MSLSTAKFSSNFEATYRRSTSGRNDSKPALGRDQRYAYGTSSGQTSRIYRATLTVNTSGTTLNLSDGTLKEEDGTTSFIITSLTGIHIEKDQSEAGNIVIGGGTNPVAFSGVADPHFNFASNTGLTVTASSTDRLKLAASTGTIEVNIAITGRA